MDTGDLEQIQLYKQGVLTVSNIKVSSSPVKYFPPHVKVIADS